MTARFHISEGSSIDRGRVADAVTLFVDSFSEPPRRETWSSELASDFLFGLLTTDTIFVEATGADEEMVGFGIALPVHECPDVVGLTPDDRTRDGYYLATVAVASQSRRKGIGRELIALLLHGAFRRSSSHVLARTRRDSHSIRSVLSDFGFHIVASHDAEIGGEAILRDIHSLSRHDYATHTKEHFFEAQSLQGDFRQYSVPGFSRLDAEHLLRTSGIHRDATPHLLEVRRRY